MEDDCLQSCKPTEKQAYYALSVISHRSQPTIAEDEITRSGDLARMLDICCFLTFIPPCFHTKKRPRLLLTSGVRILSLGTLVSADRLSDDTIFAQSRQEEGSVYASYICFREVELILPAEVPKNIRRRIAHSGPTLIVYYNIRAADLQITVGARLAMVHVRRYLSSPKDSQSR